jgi:hypothetical protein
VVAKLAEDTDDSLRRFRDRVSRGKFCREAFMTKWILEAILAATLVFVGTANDAVAETPLQAAARQRTPDTTELSASRRTRHHARYTSRRYYPLYQPYFYYDRPYYYAPAPFVPFNFGYTVPWW